MSLPPPSPTLPRQTGCCTCCQTYTAILEEKITTDLTYLLRIYTVLFQEKQTEQLVMKRQKILELLSLLQTASPHILENRTNEGR
jgi:hypothetical protein